jgi:hypothetical protein
MEIILSPNPGFESLALAPWFGDMDGIILTREISTN